MARTAGRNFAKTITVSPLGPTDTSVTVQDAAPLVPEGDFYPFYVVLDRGSETNREVALVTAVDGNLLTLGQRYLEGSLAPSGISHDAGISVENQVVHQYVKDVWDAIDAIAVPDQDRFFLMGG